MYDGPYPFIQTGDVARAARYIQEYSQTLNQGGFAVSKQFPAGTLVMTIAANIGDVAILGFEACFPDSIVGFIPSRDSEIEFLYYVFSAMKEEFLSTATLGTQLNLNIDRVASEVAPVPPANDQRAIVSFLDVETRKIDRLMGVRRRQIEVLREQRAAVIHHAVTQGLDPTAPMKDSGIEWLGKIPKHWEVQPLWSVTRIRNSNVDKKSIEGEQPVILCNYVDVYKNEFIHGQIEFMEATATGSEKLAFALREGDVIITKDSEDWRDIAVPAIVVETIPHLLCGYHLALLRAGSAILAGYLFRLLQSKACSSYFATKALGVTRFGLAQHAVRRCMTPVPPKSEQEAIVTHIDRETVKSDTLISKYERELVLLEEYRSSLISHAVTGKIDVRGLVESDEEPERALL